MTKLEDIGDKPIRLLSIKGGCNGLLTRGAGFDSQRGY